MASMGNTKASNSVEGARCKFCNFMGGTLLIAWAVRYTGGEDRAIGFFRIGEHVSWWSRLSRSRPFQRTNEHKHIPALSSFGQLWKMGSPRRRSHVPITSLRARFSDGSNAIVKTAWLAWLMPKCVLTKGSRVACLPKPSPSLRDWPYKPLLVPSPLSIVRSAPLLGSGDGKYPAMIVSTALSRSLTPRS